MCVFEKEREGETLSAAGNLITALIHQREEGVVVRTRSAALHFSFPPVMEQRTAWAFQMSDVIR